MKKILALMLCLAVAAVCLSGCTYLPLMQMMQNPTASTGNSAGTATVNDEDTVTISRAQYERYQQFDKLIELMDDVNQYYFRDVETSQMLDGAAAGLLASVGDPYTFYYTAEKFQEMWEDDNGEYVGVGMLISTSYVTGLCTIARVFKDSPAEKAGVQRGDILYKVEDLYCNPETINDAVNIMRGVAGTDVTVVFLRGEEEITTVMTRAPVNVTRAEGTMLDDEIGYIALYEFQGDCTERTEAAIQELLAANVKGIILDLRDNPGGWVDDAHSIGNFFLDKGVLCSIHYKDGYTEYDYTDDGKLTDVPLVVLVNENSASSSEILTGALRDRANAKVVGVTTFGKGIMQVVLPVGSDGSGAQMTIAEYYTPNGTAVHEVGIEPDVVSELPEGDNGSYQFADMNDPQLKTAYEVMQQMLQEPSGNP